MPRSYGLLVAGAVGCSTANIGKDPPGCGELWEARHIKRSNAASVVSSNAVTRVKGGQTQIEQKNSVASVCGDCVARTQMQAGMTNELNSIPVSADRGPGKRNECVFGNFNSSQTAIADCCSERFEGGAAVDHDPGAIAIQYYPAVYVDAAGIERSQTVVGVSN